MKQICNKMMVALALMIGMLLGGSLGDSSALEIIIQTEPDAEEDSYTGSLDSYVDAVLIPQSGRASEGEYFSDFITSEEGYVTGRERIVLNGILSSEIRDFDGDGDSELLVLSAENITPEEGGDYACNTVYLSMYEKEEESVVLKDRIEALTEVMGSCDRENSGIFLVKNDDRIYICGSSYQGWSIRSDGISFHSFIVTYEEGGFVSLFDSGTWNGSDFWGDIDLEICVDKLAEFSDSFGLSEEASAIRDAEYPYFSFIDDKEKMLLKITGDAPDFSQNYYTDYDPSYLGRVRFILQTTSYNAGDSSGVSSQIADNDNMKSQYADIVLRYEEQYGQDDYDISEPSSLSIVMKGVYYLKLLDFNQDGAEELMIGYTVQDAGEDQYGLDIWEYKDGQTRQIYSDLSASSNILYTFYEGQYYLMTGSDSDESGLQFLTVDGETFQAEWTLIRSDDAFYINGSETQSNDYYDFYYNLLAERKSFSPYQIWRPTEGFLQVRPVRSLLGLPELDDNSSKGKCGGNISWDLNDKNILYISGTGEMYDYEYDTDFPWNEFREEIRWVYVDDGVTSIDAGAFANCYNLTYARLPEGITKIASNTFRDCSCLTYFNIPDTVKSIGMYAFSNCYGIKSVYMPQSLEQISSLAFYACDGLSSIYFYGDAPTMGEDAFAYVTAEIRYPGDNPTWNYSVFSIRQTNANLTWTAR